MDELPEDLARPCDAPLLAADSWLVDDGAVVGAAWHRRRFEATVAAADPAAHAAHDWPAFWKHVRAAVPERGRWFPRVELAAGRAPSVRVRPAPPRRATTVLRWDGTADARVSPRTKGPDLALLASMRERARAAGADCAVITAPDETVRETATGSLLWWEGDVLCAPEDPEVLPGVTASLVLAGAEAAGMRTDRRSRRIDELLGREVWHTNSLHGVTGVTTILVPGAWVPTAEPLGAVFWHAAWTSWAHSGPG